MCAWLGLYNLLQSSPKTWPSELKCRSSIPASASYVPKISQPGIQPPPAQLLSMTALPATAGDIPRISIITAHSIKNKTSQCLWLLYPDASKPSAASTTPLSAVALVAKSVAASKAITIIEIIKRRMAEQGDHCYQYSALSSVTVDMAQLAGSGGSKRGQQSRRDQKSHSRSNRRDQRKKLEEGKEGFGQEEEEDPFESMEEKAQPIRKRMPLLTIYISKSPIIEFARLYG